MRHGQEGRGRFPPLQRVEVEQLACCSPAGLGLEVAYWSTRSLARIAIKRGVAPRVAHSTVSLILRDADLQPHRSRYWKTATLNEEFRARAARILWCYERAFALAKREELVICLDEEPSIEALDRAHLYPMRPGQIERREFEYERQGTVNFLVALVVHSGKMRGGCLEKNDGEQLRRVLPKFFYSYRQAWRIHLIWDNGPSHIAGDTQLLRGKYRHRINVLFTPAHASWLNQAELLLRALEAQYLSRGI